MWWTDEGLVDSGRCGGPPTLTLQKYITHIKCCENSSKKYLGTVGTVLRKQKKINVKIFTRMGTGTVLTFIFDTVVLNSASTYIQLREKGEIR